MSKRYHVTPTSQGRWVIKRANATGSIETFDRKTEAVEAARKVARRDGGELVIHGRNGRIMDTDTYPKGFGSLKNQYTIRKGVDLTKPLYIQTAKSKDRKR